MRLRYFLGLVATLALTACSVEVDLEEASLLNVTVDQKPDYAKFILANGQTGFAIHEGENDVINGNYDLVYVASEQNIFKVEDYENGELEKAKLLYRSNVMNAENLAHICHKHLTVTVPGKGTVDITPDTLTTEYKIVRGSTEDANAMVLKSVQLIGLPSAFNLLTGEPIAYNLKVNLTTSASAILPTMTSLPEKAVARVDGKNHKIVLENNTITIK